MPLHLDSVRGWWLLLRDVLLFALGASIWIYELLLTPDTPASAAIVSLGAGATAMALPWAFRQDEKKNDG